MENVIKWKVEDWCDHASYEAMIQAVGAKEIEPYVEARKRARIALEASLTPEQRDLHATFSDAWADATAAREAVAVRIGLTAGVAIGGALMCFPEEPAEKVIDLAVGGVVSLLTADLPPDVAHDVAIMAVRTLSRAAEAPVGNVGGHRRIRRSGFKITGKVGSA